MATLSSEVGRCRVGLRACWQGGRTAFALGLISFGIALGGCDAKSAPEPKKGTNAAVKAVYAGVDVAPAPSTGISALSANVPANVLPLVVGSDGSSEPFNAVNPRGMLVGFDVDLANGVAQAPRSAAALRRNAYFGPGTKP
jgi:ABC-type amino acid transport substrate-binding protein